MAATSAKLAAIAILCGCSSQLGTGMDASRPDGGHAVDAGSPLDAGSDLDAPPAPPTDGGPIDIDSWLPMLDAGSTASGWGTIVPLYTDPPDESWTRIATEAQAHPTVAVVAIINPSNGPTASAESNYVTGIAGLQSAGIRVLGYVATGYASRAISDVEHDIDLYVAQYPTLDGIFFDEAAIYETGHESHYSALADYARAQGLAFTVANPGTSALSSYLPFFEVSLVYESDGTVPASSLDTYRAQAAHVGIIPYAVPSLDPAYVASVRPDTRWIYLTDDDLPNPWDSLSSYFGALLGALE